MQMEASKESQHNVLNLSKEAFEKLVRKQHIDNLVPGPCVFDVNPMNILSSPQGSWALVLNDLQLVFNSKTDEFDNSELIDKIESVCRCEGVQNAFNFRRELVNLKKVAAHIYGQIKDMEMKLKQLTTYYYSDKVLDQRAKLGYKQSLRYAEISSIMTHVRGASYAMQDIRFYLKAICCVPRHPSKPRLERLAKLPIGLKSYKILSSALFFLKKHNRKHVETNEYSNIVDDYKEMSLIDTTTNYNNNDTIITPPNDILNALLNTVSKSIPNIPSHVISYLKSLFVARGVSKALSIYEEAKRFNNHIFNIKRNLKKLLQKHFEVLKENRTHAQEDEMSVERYSFQANIDLYISQINGSTTVLETMIDYLTSMLNDPTQRLFVASDLNTSNEMTFFAPSNFLNAISNITSIGMAALKKYQPSMFFDMEVEGWPPSEQQRPGINGRCKCKKCNSKLGSMWINANLHICLYCENQLRNANYYNDAFTNIRDSSRMLTSRLLLRPFEKGDQSMISNLCNEFEVASMCSLVPYPYSDDHAQYFLSKICTAADKMTFAITQRENNELVGCISLDDIKKLEKEKTAIIGYWLGKNYWGRGFMTEAATAIISYGFDKLELDAVHGYCWVENEKSANVMKKVGFEQSTIFPPGMDVSAPCLARGMKTFSRNYYQLSRDNYVSRLKSKHKKKTGSNNNYILCPFRSIGCKMPKAFCLHSNRCFSCDHWSCPKCNLIRGDGMTVESIVDDIISSPESDENNAETLCLLGGIFLDFDRTFCSTKSGGSPLPQGKVKPQKGGNIKIVSDHTLDQGLLNLAFNYPNLVHIVTRNSHVDDIRTFLDINNVPASIKIRSVKKEQTTKGAVIQTILKTKKEEILMNLNERTISTTGKKISGQSKRQIISKKIQIIGVFVDDDIREHLHPEMNSVINDADNLGIGLRRILFVRDVRK